MSTWILRALAIALLVSTVYYVPRLLRMLDIGSGYVAKQVCSCVYVANRDFETCRHDIPKMMDVIAADLLRDPNGVRATAPLPHIQRTALHRPGFGCSLIP